MTTFTEQQLSDWRRYEKVRRSGCFNMLSELARDATRLDRDRYLFVLHNYAALQAAQASPLDVEDV